MASPRFLLSKADWKKIGTGLLLAIIGAVLAWVSETLIPLLQDSPDSAKLLLAAVLAATVNVIRKWLTDTRPMEGM